MTKVFPHSPKAAASRLRAEERRRAREALEAATNPADRNRSEPRKRPPEPPVAWEPPPDVPHVPEPPAQHDAHVGAYKMEQLAPFLLERRVQAQIAMVIPANFKRAFIRMHRRRESVRDSEIFKYLTRDFSPRPRWATDEEDDSLDHRLTHEFAVRIQAWWKSKPSGLGPLESKVGGYWAHGAGLGYGGEDR